MTVEDPVEYALPGVVQMQVRPEIGFDFARAQRAMLRHNPDVMMVGEIRDRESASVAVQAALTGHLVLSTVHANSAAGAGDRALDLGVEPFLVAAALIGAGAQRLARRLCAACAEADAPAPEALRRIGAPDGGEWRRAGGCASCGGSGVKGRVPVAEAFLASRAFADAVRGPSPSETALGRAERRDAAASRGARLRRQRSDFARRSAARRAAAGRMSASLFRYKATLPGGARRTGVLAASSEAEAALMLERACLTPLSLAPGRAPTRPRARLAHRAAAMRRLAALTAARAPLDRALRLAGGSESARPLFADLAIAVASGRPLSTAMADWPADFPRPRWR